MQFLGIGLMLLLMYISFCSVNNEICQIDFDID